MTGNAVLKGVRFIVDEKGRRTSVVIDLKENGDLWEDLYDRGLARKRKDEPRESLASVKARLAKAGKVSA